MVILLNDRCLHLIDLKLTANLCITASTGAIVAIRDLNQQMYVSVNNTGNTYQVVGTFHYSLAGEHALFKVIT
jgi:hypothetical protein